MSRSLRSAGAQASGRDCRGAKRNIFVISRGGDRDSEDKFRKGGGGSTKLLTSEGFPPEISSLKKDTLLQQDASGKGDAYCEQEEKIVVVENDSEGPVGTVASETLEDSSLLEGKAEAFCSEKT